MSLGLAVRLSQMIDIQREQQLASLDPLEAFLRRRLFWAMFMIDRLVKIIGKATTQLYPATDQSQRPADTIVVGLESELHSWLASTPTFFNPLYDGSNRDESLFYDIPWILKRQQRTVKAAFFFANMLIYRGHVLREFRCQEPSTPHSSPLSARAEKCADNALSMIALAADFGINECRYNGTFWITSHFLFCAISILLVYLNMCQNPEQRLRVEKAIGDAMAFHRKLDSSVNISAQRLLDVSISNLPLLTLVHFRGWSLWLTLLQMQESHWRAQIIGTLNPPTSLAMETAYEAEIGYQESHAIDGETYFNDSSHPAPLPSNPGDASLEPVQDIVSNTQSYNDSMMLTHRRVNWIPLCQTHLVHLGASI
ncbi:unnamed protein product [Penicillium olsonii]|uniref:Transcription factor domain-containing protein n=1 Tax=Penicillium olsonii TaxID=99116 RepID=A0A9W4N6G2_PENOL|nr:unnamed protein product [Penicillium olsonii]CAG8300989.1 unnamed protein product [Penicillium olsonii]